MGESRLEIRPFRESDLDAVVRLWRVVFPDAPAHNEPLADIRRKLSVQPELFLVATAGADLVATAMAGFDGHRGWVHYLAVHPERRRGGIGRAIMAAVEAELEAQGCTKLNLQVRASNRQGVEFYRRLGFAVEDRVSMGKRLG